MISLNLCYHLTGFPHESIKEWKENHEDNYLWYALDEWNQNGNASFFIPILSKKENNIINIKWVDY